MSQAELVGSADELQRELVELRSRLEEVQRELQQARELNAARTRPELERVVSRECGHPAQLPGAQGPLHASERFLRAVFDGAMDAFLVADDQGVYVDANPAACELFGLSKEQLIGMRIRDFRAPEATDSVSWESFQKEGRVHGEFLLRRADGERRTLEYNAVADFLPGLHLSVLRDVTARKAAEHARRAAEQQLRTVVANAPMILFAIDREGNYTVHEGKAVESLNLERGQLIGQSLIERMRARPGAESAIKRALAGEEVRGEFTIGELTFECAVLPLRDDHGQVTGLTGVAMDVSARKAAEAALRASEARFRAMIERSEDGITLLSADARTIYHSPAVERMLGYSIEDAKQMAWQDYLELDEQPKLQRALERLLSGPGATASLDFRIRRKDGARRWLELTATNLLHDPDVRAIVSNFRDVTERRALEREREGFFRMSVDLLCIAGLDGKLRSLNPAWEATLGWSVEELTARPWLDFVHPDDRAATEALGERLAMGQPVTNFENRYRCKDGSYRRLQWSTTPVLDESLVFGIARDVTEQYAAAERARLLFSASPLPMWLLDGESLRVIDVNDAALAMYGYDRAEFLQLTLFDLAVDTQADDVRAKAHDALRQGSVTVTGRRHRTKTQGERIVEVTGHLLELAGRSALLSVIIDVTEKRRIEEERRASEQRYRSIVENTSEGIWMYDETGKTTFMNARMAEMLGWTVAEAIGQPIFTFMDAQSADEARLRLERRTRGARERGDFRLRRRDGSDLWVSVNADALLDANGKFVEALALLADITEQRAAAATLRRSEEQLRQAQKMEAVGNLAGGIAHDFNNILFVILGYTGFLLEDLRDCDSALRAQVEEIHGAGLRATALVKQLLAFSRRQVLQPSVMPVNDIVMGVKSMLSRLLTEDIELTILTSPSAGKVYADAGQLEQVLLNLVVNARDAMPSGGRLTIETKNVPLSADHHAGVPAGDYVMIAVTDTGIGMDSATQARIFEPFFTTKDKNRGTGLGLSTVYGIVQQSGGHISVYSEPGQGTTFKIYFLRNDEDARHESFPDPQLVAPRGWETILLVEDDAQVRAVVHAILRKSGFKVLEAQNGGEAFLLCEEHKGEIHMLVTDVVMPRMSGPRLAERLVQMRPDLKVLYLSGYTEDSIIQHGVLAPGVEFLSKPVVGAALLQKVRQILDAETRGRVISASG